MRARWQLRAVRHCGRGEARRLAVRLLPQLRQHEGKWRGAGELLGTGRVGPERGRGGCLALVRFVGPPRMSLPDFGRLARCPPVRCFGVVVAAERSVHCHTGMYHEVPCIKARVSCHGRCAFRFPGCGPPSAVLLLTLADKTLMGLLCRCVRSKQTCLTLVSSSHCCS